MSVFFVSRHAGAIEWAARQGIKAERLLHLDIEHVETGDIVIGNLPIQLVSELTARKARFFNLDLTVPEAMRGRELDADTMQALGAKLVEYTAHRIVSRGKPWTKSGKPGSSSRVSSSKSIRGLA